MVKFEDRGWSDLVRHGDFLRRFQARREKEEARKAAREQKAAEKAK